VSAFLPNKYARCECSLWEFGTHPVKENYPICTYFEDIMEGGEPHDICKECRHGEECHLKGREPAGQRVDQ